MSPDTRVYRLLVCKHADAVKLRQELFDDIKKISPEAESHFHTLSLHEGFAWLLSCACSRNMNPDPPENNRVPLRGSPLIAGESVSPIHGRKDPDTNLQSYLDFRDIESRHIHDLQVYTDGSAPCGLAGFGAVIYEPLNRKPVYESSVEIGETTNNVTELEALHNALRWTVDSFDNLTFSSKYMHLRTDSQCTRDVLLAPSTPRCHAYLAESIKALGAKLRYNHASPVTVHWIPSHIELTAWADFLFVGTAERTS